MQLREFIRDRRFDSEWQEVFKVCQEAENPPPPAEADDESGFAPHDAPEGSAADKAKASDGKVGATVKILTNDEELRPTPFPIADCIGEMVCAEDFAIDPLQPFAPEVGAPTVESALVACDNSSQVDEPAPHTVVQVIPSEVVLSPSAEDTRGLAPIECEQSSALPAGKPLSFAEWFHKTGNSAPQRCDLHTVDGNMLAQHEYRTYLRKLPKRPCGVSIVIAAQGAFGSPTHHVGIDRRQRGLTPKRRLRAARTSQKEASRRRS